MQLYSLASKNTFIFQHLSLLAIFASYICDRKSTSRVSMGLFSAWVQSNRNIDITSSELLTIIAFSQATKIAQQVRSFCLNFKQTDVVGANNK